MKFEPFDRRTPGCAWRRFRQVDEHCLASQRWREHWAPADQTSEVGVEMAERSTVERLRSRSAQQCASHEGDGARQPTAGQQRRRAAMKFEPFDRPTHEIRPETRDV